jgi:hypothetical protein
MLNSETASKYLLEVIIPFCEDQCNHELTLLGIPPLNNEQFMEFINLKTLTVVTTWRWLRLLGFCTARTRSVTILMVMNEQTM